MTPHTITTVPARLLTRAEAAALLGIDVRTVTRLAGRLGSVRTLGGHRRFDPAEVHAPPAGRRIERQPTHA
jgi:excisionase family DNA binding protein